MSPIRINKDRMVGYYYVRLKVIYISALCLVCSHNALAQQQKYALVIGVKSYQYVAPLKNSLNDARDVATASGDSQRPWIASDYAGDFFFTPGKQTQPIAQPIAIPVSKNVSQTKENQRTEADVNSIKIGSQVWQIRNLDVDHFANGDPIPQAKTPEEWSAADANKRPARCYYDGDPANGELYGKIYNWYAVKNPRGLAPRSWHIPSNTEWSMLIEQLGGEEKAGSSMKNTAGWFDLGNGNNGSGFAAHPGGYRNPDGTFGPPAKYGNWWSSTEYITYSAWYFLLSYMNETVGRSSYSKECGISVRCIQD